MPGLILADEFRDGNVPAGAKAVAFLKRCVAMLPADEKLSRVRGNSAWYQAEALNGDPKLDQGTKGMVWHGLDALRETHANAVYFRLG